MQNKNGTTHVTSGYGVKAKNESVNTTMKEKKKKYIAMSKEDCNKNYCHTQDQNITPSYKMKAQHNIKREKKKIDCKKMLSSIETQMQKHKDERSRHTKMRVAHTKTKEANTQK